MSDSFPLPSELVPVGKVKEGRVDVKPLIERALKDPNVMGKIRPLLTNGLVNGHKILDQNEIVGILINFDKMNGNGIATSNLLRMTLINQTNVVLRRFYVLDKQGKFISVNTKRYADPALTHSTPRQE